jgi:hypothetical protein
MTSTYLAVTLNAAGPSRNRRPRQVGYPFLVNVPVDRWMPQRAVDATACRGCHSVPMDATVIQRAQQMREAPRKTSRSHGSLRPRRSHALLRPFLSCVLSHATCGPSPSTRGTEGPPSPLSTAFRIPNQLERNGRATLLPSLHCSGSAGAAPSRYQMIAHTTEDRIGLR